MTTSAPTSPSARSKYNNDNNYNHGGQGKPLCVTRFRQWIFVYILTLDSIYDTHNSRLDTCLIVSVSKMGSNFISDDTTGDRIRQRSFKSITCFDSHEPVLNSNKQ